MTGAVTRFGHMLLFVSDMDASLAFYTKQLGFKVRPAKPLQDGRPFVAFEQGLALVGGGGNEPRHIDHIAFEVDDIYETRDRLKSADARFVQDLHDGPYGLTVYVTGPDGLKIELYQTGLAFEASPRTSTS